MSASPLLTGGLGSFSTVARLVLRGLAPTASATAPAAASRARSAGQKRETARRPRTTK